jgi:hypothetical protein
MESALRVGELVVPTRASPTFHEKHGFGVIMAVAIDEVNSTEVTTYEVKFTKSLQAFRFSYDGVKRYE